ncbi:MULTISPECIES: single-stranded DNA-binding protein [unclassified Commensalibacter]|uniref:single-stranded DNA-binding protein n=1 Tax=unclassified Commensalibacter TaxID=2630218 RepID=UPI0018DBEA70|nr:MULTISPECIES: single-stranded DNA-binding protein [unclassified Commensalibacter]MBH9970520.1 single-stranded DNA-binding protein [Commensalibacter sp. M0265]MBH9977785.1 single-stranded DNA-binding protein [Commensalibacter sp. M0266]MBH9993555.1 single-stranded DNA-binding protein [Commensalibacter sp. M0270]MBI0047051.1 single-stranded DNA-binding protein [Commensalibacter sp. M0267]MBI0056720.1 single-stranded DNA-binding protein [Commensalibacter sp. M0268]
MSGFINKVVLIGILAKDPEIKLIQSGDNIATLVLMVNDSWENRRTAQQINKIEYFKVVVFSKNLIKQIETVIKKGDQLYIEGQLKVRKWYDEQKNNHYSAEIVLFSHNGILVLLNDNNIKEELLINQEASS